MKTINNNSGFSIIPVLLLVVVVAIAGFVGWRVYDTQNTTKNNTNLSTPATKQSTEQPIKSKADLEKDQSALDSSNVDGDLDTTAISQDLNNLL